MSKVCEIKIGKKTYSYEEGTTFQQIADELQSKYEHDIVLVKENGKLRELHKKVSRDCVLEMVTTADSIGHKTYKRSMNLLLYKAIRDVTQGQNLRVFTHFSVSNAFYYTIRGELVPDQEFIDRVKARMREMVDAALPITKHSLPTDQARALFRSLGLDDKDELFRFRRGGFVNLYTLDGYDDYFYGYMVSNTRYLQTFDLQLYDEGFVLILPEKHAPESLDPFTPSPKTFAVQKRSEAWGEKLGLDTIGRLNSSICNERMKHVILVEEAQQEARIAEISAKIAAKEGVKFVMIAGPSSSGKTTFSRRMSIQLTAHGLSPHPISLDNYYRERTEIPKDENGEYDFECLEALDLALFEEQMTKLMEGESVEIPRYNFTTGSKEYKGDMMQLGEHDILVLEGIHGLNANMSAFIPAERKFKIYISAMTQMNIDEHNRIPTTDGRLLRRIVRDNRTRSTSAQETIAMWDSVRRGEDRYIFPNQEEADETFNSALLYETAVLKLYAEPLLFQIPEHAKEYLEAKRLLKFMDYFIGIPTEEIPRQSILREFIGGSCFEV